MKEIKTISYFANNRIPGEKAHSIYVLKMCDAFASKGIDVELITPFRFQNAGKTNDLRKIPDIKYHFIIRRIPSPDFLPLMKVFGDTARPLYLIQGILFAALAVLRAVFVSSKSLYITCDLWTAYFLHLAFPSRTSLDIHVLPKSRIRKYMLKSLFQRGMPAVAVTEGMKYILMAEFKASSKQILVLPNAYDESMFNTNLDKTEARKVSNLPDDKYIVGYVGKFTTMGKSKGVENLVEALRIINDSMFMLLLVGDDEAHLPPHGDVNIAVVPHIPQSGLLPYLRSCNVVAMPFPRIEHYEKYMSPMKLFEYMASGIPIITTDLPSVREVVADREVFFIKDNSPQQIADAIKSLRNNPQLANALADASLKKVKENTWQRRAELFISFLLQN